MDDLDRVIRQLLSADFPDKTIRGKKIVMEHRTVSPSDYLVEMFNPTFKFGTNNPEFDNQDIITRNGRSTTFVAVDNYQFVVNVDSDDEMKFAVVRNPGPQDDTATLISKADMSRVGRTPYTVLSLLFDNLLGVIIDVLENRSAVLFTGAEPDLTKLYINAFTSKRFRDVESKYNIKAVVKGQYILLKKDPM